jgi:lysozyme family protein
LSGFLLENHMIDVAALKRANAKRWVAAKPSRDFSGAARRLVSPDAKARYLSVSAKTGVPWALIAVIHERECSQDWALSLAQGDPWSRVSVHVPVGRGPFKSWEEAAIDALVDCAPYAARNEDWDIGSALTKLEEYNGLGYASRNRPSPYIWSGTNQYTSGKYVRDGAYDPEVVDSQLGCAGLLLAMMALDPTIAFSDTTISPPKPAAAPAQVSLDVAKPSVTHPSKGSIGAFIASILSTIFNSRRKLS